MFTFMHYISYEISQNFLFDFFIYYYFEIDIRK